MIEDKAREIATRLREAERTRTAVSPIRLELGEEKIDVAYRVQFANAQHRFAAGQKIRGRKVGLTSRAVQRQLGVDQPDFGILFDSMERPNGGVIALHELIQPKIEGEIAFVLGRDLNSENPCLQEVIAATEYVLPCLEVVDSRIQNWNIHIVDTVADNASAALFVLGVVPKRLTDFDFLNCGMVLRENGEVCGTGAGAASLGNPVEAVRWLAAKAAKLGKPLQAGEVVLSGALSPMVPVRANANYMASIADLGSVSINFA
jgi:2-keto-4-pentenoate hydratase